MRTATLGNHVQSWPKRRITELVGVGLLSFAAFLLVALMSFHAKDPSLNVRAARQAQNMAGKPGAYFADMLLQTLGLASSLVVAVIGAWGWRLMTRGRTPLLIGVRVVAFLLSLLVASLLLSFIPAPAFWPFSSAGGFGGALGACTGAMLKRHHAALVVTLPFLLCLLIGSLPAAWGLSWGEWKQGVRHVLRALWHVGKRAATVPPEAKAPANPSRAVAVYAEEKPSISRPEHWLVRLFRYSRPEDSVMESREDEAWETEEEQTGDFAPAAPASRAAKKPPVAVTLPKTKPSRPAPAPLASPEDLGDYLMPPLELLSDAPKKAKRQTVNEAALSQKARFLETVLNDFGVYGSIVNIRPGPVVTLYELEPSPGTKSSRVIGLADDIARSMSAVSARIATVTGRNVIGIELPNATRETVYLRELLEEEEFRAHTASLPLAMGKDIGGAPIIVDLARMPHVLVAGTTGSGKSVAINTMITSLLYKLTPAQCKFIMIDPKMLELSVYDAIPHLLSPVVTEPGKAVVALKWTVKEMENRYRLMSSLSVRNIDGYNKRIREAIAKGETLTRSVQTGFNPDTGTPIIETVTLEMTPLPFIVVVVDEMADLMLVAGKEIESSIQRLAQMARAAGIHIIMATQRPSVDVITGVIKANFPTRISFQVTSRIDSRTILGEQGAEQLLGQGDMLYMAGGGRITRVHGPFVSDKEVEDIVAHLRLQGAPAYVEDVTREPEELGLEGDGDDGEDGDIYRQAVAIVLRDKKASTSYLQRVLKLGYNRAARLIDRMETEGIVGPANHVGKREVIG